MTDAEYISKLAGLNNSQRDAFDQIVHWTCQCHQYFMGECNSTRTTTYLHNRWSWYWQKPLYICFNIGGLTIHYAFWLAVEHGNLTRYTKLSAEKLHQLRLLCKDVHTVTIDEISMVSYEIFKFHSPKAY